MLFSEMEGFLVGCFLYYGESLPDFSFRLVYAKRLWEQVLLPGSLEASKVQGKIVVCDRGGNARVEKGSAVKLAGGLGMIMANTAESGEELLDAHLWRLPWVGQIAGDEITRSIKVESVPNCDY